MKNNRLFEILKKENKAEEMILLILSIVGLILGVLGLTDILSVNLKNEKVFLIFLTVASVISLFLSIFKLIKRMTYNKIPKSKIIKVLEEVSKNKNAQFFEMLEEYGYKLYKEDDSGILIANNDIIFSLYKDELQFIIMVNKKQIAIDIDLNEQLLEEVDEKYFEEIVPVDTIIQQMTEDKSIYELLNDLNHLLSEHKQQYLDLYNKYKK